jgi:hypothetical protein
MNTFDTFLADHAAKMTVLKDRFDKMQKETKRQTKELIASCREMVEFYGPPPPTNQH